MSLFTEMAGMLVWMRGEFRDGEGVSFKNQRTGETLVGVLTFLDEAQLEKLQIEDGTNPLGPNPFMLDSLEEGIDLVIGDLITLPADGDDDADRKQIVTPLKQERIGTTVVRTYVVGFDDPPG